LSCFARSRGSLRVEANPRDRASLGGLREFTCVS